MFHVKQLPLTLALLLGSPLAQAEEVSVPSWQGNSGFQVGIAGQGRGAFWEETLFHGGLRGDLLWGRKDPFAWGYGPMLGVSTQHFRDLNLAAGASVLIPVSEYLPVVLQGGPFLRFQKGTHPGIFGTLFWGARSFNYHSHYGIAAGLSVEARLGLDSEKERTLIVAAHVDTQALALPVLLLINAFR